MLLSNVECCIRILTYRFIAWKVVLDESSSRETIYDEWMNIIIIASKKLEHWAKVVNWICRVQRVSYTNERFQCYAKRWMRLLRTSCCEFTLLFLNYILKWREEIPDRCFSIPGLLICSCIWEMTSKRGIL